MGCEAEETTPSARETELPLRAAEVLSGSTDIGLPQFRRRRDGSPRFEMGAPNMTRRASNRDPTHTEATTEPAHLARTVATEITN